MNRTQVRIDKHKYAQAKKEAAELGISVAELIRRAIRRMLPSPGSAPWMRYAGCIDSGSAQYNRSIDDIVYGAKD